ncbi:LysR family transcriptional regulator [Burkholderia sp. MR1-5-21]
MDAGLFLDFLVLAETKNFTRAAEIRHVSQAAFSRRIQALEVWARTALVERGMSPIRLTDAGQKLRVSAAEISAHISRAREELVGNVKKNVEHIKIGTTNTLATLFLPELWERWSDGKALSANIKVGDIYDLVTELASGNIDLLIVYQCPTLPLYLDARRYDAKVIMPDMLSPVASRTWVESGAFEWPGCQSAPVPLVLWPAGNYFARLVEKIMQDAPARLIGNKVMESSASDVLRAMTARGFCVSWLPERAIKKAGLDCIALGEGGWSLPLAVMAFRDRENESPSLDRLWGSLDA